MLRGKNNNNITIAKYCSDVGVYFCGLYGTIYRPHTVPCAYMNEWAAEAIWHHSLPGLTKGLTTRLIISIKKT
jgi:hypothetical protein